MNFRITILTSLALICFAANSLLCRGALGVESIDPISFTVIRLVTGALALFLIVALSSTAKFSGSEGSWLSALALFSYAILFSLAYVRINAGVGALLLFGAVQITMVAWSIHKGEKPAIAEVLGILLAFGGVGCLVFPGLTAPDFIGSVLMIGAGISWGAYTLRGKRAVNPLRTTARNFILSTPIVIGVGVILILPDVESIQLSQSGIALAAISGAVTSGVGYAIWYAALPSLTATRAAIVQLSVPVIAALLGIAFLNERFTLRLAISGVTILGGIAIAIVCKRRPKLYAQPSRTS